MISKIADPLPKLYESDETAWLDTMSDLIHGGRLGELDYPHLAEFLADMARRDKREVSNRLAILIAHLLKWMHQPTKRSGSWRRTVVVQRQALMRLLESGALRNHAESTLAEAYANAVEQANAETELDEQSFPAECPFTLDQVLSPEALEE